MCDGCNGKGWRWHRSQAIDPWTMLPLVFTNYHRLSFSKIITRFNDKWLISVVSANDYLHSLTTIIASFCLQSTTPPIHSSLCTLPGTSTGPKDRKQSSVRNALLMKMMTNKSQVQSFWRCVDRHQLKARPPITMLNFCNCIFKHVLEIQERNRWNGNSFQLPPVATMRGVCD